MLCPHCHEPIESPVTRLRRKRRALGLCQDCKADLGPNPRYSRCLSCRRHEAELAKARRSAPIK